MIGATLDELYEDLKENHEFVFDIHGIEYVIQLEVRNGDDFLVIYPWTEGKDCIAEQHQSLKFQMTILMQSFRKNVLMEHHLWISLMK